MSFVDVVTRDIRLHKIMIIEPKQSPAAITSSKSVGGTLLYTWPNSSYMHTDLLLSAVPRLCCYSHSRADRGFGSDRQRLVTVAAYPIRSESSFYPTHAGCRRHWCTDLTAIWPTPETTSTTRLWFYTWDCLFIRYRSLYICVNAWVVH